MDCRVKPGNDDPIFCGGHFFDYNLTTLVANWNGRARVSKDEDGPSCFETAASPPPQHEGEERAGRRECRDGVHDRASGMSHKATVVAIPCFCPVPPCYRRPNRAMHATPPVRISRLHTAAYEQRRGARLWPAACFFAVIYREINTGPRASPSRVADAAVHHYLYTVSAGLA